MKLKKYIIIAFAGALSLTGCKDYLSVSSPSQFTASSVFSTEAGAYKVLLGAYECFCQDPYTSRMSDVWAQNTDVETSSVSSAPDGSRRDIWSLQGNDLTNFSDLYSAWNNCYLAIDRANQCIEGINGSSVKSSATMQEYLGEAYCLRAYWYLMMCNTWGDVPYFAESAKEGVTLDRPRMDKNKIYSMELQALVNAEPNMEFSDVSSGGIERMNRDFCMGLIARIALFRAGYGMTQSGTMKRADDYLDVANNDSLDVTYTDINGTKKTASTYEEYYQLAKDYCQKLISLKNRSLRASYSDIFNEESSLSSAKFTNDEVLYEVAFLSGNGGDVGWCIGVPVTASSKGTTTIQVNLTPSYYLSFDSDDVRRDVTCSRIQYSSDTQQATLSPTSIATGKWNRLLLTNSPGSSSSKGTGINWPVMRWSDVLLMLAESENELNGPTTIAKNALKTVRARAFGQADQQVKVQNYVDNLTTKDDFFNAVVNERGWEFGGECMRKYDLVRWNLYGQKILYTKHFLSMLGLASLSNYADNLAIFGATSVADVQPYLNYADALYYQFSSDGTKIIWYNNQYRPAVVPTVVTTAAQATGKNYMKLGWGSAMATSTTNTTTGAKTYSPSTYITYSWRGYTGVLGTEPVPYVLPIPYTIVSNSAVLTNKGYCLN